MKFFCCLVMSGVGWIPVCFCCILLSSGEDCIVIMMSRGSNENFVSSNNEIDLPIPRLLF